VVKTAASSPPEPLRASREELEPLFELCRAGRLFEVQDWIASGKPINPPPEPRKHSKFTSPLLVAIDKGFHSLVKVLLEGGALQEPDGYDSPMNRVLRLRRRDLVELLVDNGFDPKSIDFAEVLHSWDPGLMEYFLERGADPLTDQPFAQALCNRVRTALNVLKKHRETVPELQEQANIALRHHCKEGNLKWVQLLLWAGADPYLPGVDSWGDGDSERYAHWSALEIAALHRHYEVFKLKKIRAQPAHPALRQCIYSLGRGEGFAVLADLLARGLDPNDEGSGGCDAIQSWLHGLDWEIPRYRWEGKSERGEIDTDHAREHMKAIHLVAKFGGKWTPSDDEIKSARRVLLKMSPDYAVEFFWIMASYQSCRSADATTLLASPSMQKHLSKHLARADELIASLPGDAAASPSGSTLP
jgi:hypothetical protein